MPDTHSATASPSAASRDGRRDHPGRPRLRHLVRRALLQVPGLARRRRRGRGEAQALDRRGRVADRDRRRQPSSAQHAALLASRRSRRSCATARRRSASTRISASASTSRSTKPSSITNRIRARATRRCRSSARSAAATTSSRCRSIATTARVWVMIHCGIRGYGWQTANHYFYAGAELRGLPKNRREESWLRADEPLGREYWAHHNTAANYAVANRHIIVRGVQQALEDVFFASGEVLLRDLAQPRASRRRSSCPTARRSAASCIARARRARFLQVIPISRARSGRRRAIRASCRARCTTARRSSIRSTAPTRSGCSVNHGSGRLLARGAAKRELAPLQGRHRRRDARGRAHARRRRRFAASSATRSARRSTNARTSTRTSTRCSACSSAKESRDVAHRLYPVANLKGTD